MGGFRGSQPVVRFGAYELDQGAGELRKEGVRIRLQDQPLQMLLLLLEQPGRIITREELRQKIWSSDTFVDYDHGINNAIKRLRETLGDTAETPRFIETLPKRGYRFIAAVDDKTTVSRVASSAIDSIVVLPFETASSDPNTEYLAIGIPGSVTHSLSQIPDLRVISWKSAARVEGGTADPLGIARKLGVRVVLSGRIWQRENKLRLHVDLLEAESGEEIWGDQYDSDLTELFIVQDSIAREVSRNLRLKMTGETEHRLVKRYTENIEAYHLYVRGRRWCEKRSSEGFRRGIEYLGQAVQLDPKYAAAYAELAQCLAVPCYYGSVDPGEAYPKARSAALRALELDPDLAEAHAVLALILHTYDWNWSAAEKEYRRAIELNPNYTISRYHYSYFLVESGRYSEALDEATEALSRDPVSGILNAALAFVLLIARQYDRSIVQAHTAIEVDPEMTLSYVVLGTAYAQTGQLSEAIKAYEKGIALGGMVSYQKAFIGCIEANSGETAKAWKRLHELEQDALTSYVPCMATAFVYAALGEYHKAIEKLEKACEGRETNLVFLKTWPFLDALRDDARFQKIEHQVGLRN